jgi:hypothetical protein
MCVQCFHCIYPPTPFPHILLLPTGTNHETGPFLTSCSLIST